MKHSQAGVCEQERITKQQKCNDAAYWQRENEHQCARHSDPAFAQCEHARKELKHFGKDLAECIDLFLQITHDGPVYVCTSCHQTKFVDDVQELSSL